ncbi:unnamed protein product [Amoebophrya sp. A25]|nr:unnamed protein product [Amoebophrya sp. A25]|eukprot:GSA25T00013512001.1
MPADESRSSSTAAAAASWQCMLDLMDRLSVCRKATPIFRVSSIDIVEDTHGESVTRINFVYSLASTAPTCLAPACSSSRSPHAKLVNHDEYSSGNKTACLQPREHGIWEREYRGSLRLGKKPRDKPSLQNQGQQERTGILDRRRTHFASFHFEHGRNVAEYYRNQEDDKGDGRKDNWQALVDVRQHLRGTGRSGVDYQTKARSDARTSRPLTLQCESAGIIVNSTTTEGGLRMLHAESAHVVRMQSGRILSLVKSHSSWKHSDHSREKSKSHTEAWKEIFREEDPVMSAAKVLAAFKGMGGDTTHILSSRHE